MIKNILLPFFLFAWFLMQAQDPVSIHLSEKNGLPDKEFYDLFEDNKGFIWLAGDKGLFRYNGKNYKSYSNLKQRGISVFGLKQDNKGRIWCNNISGQFFYTKNNKLHLFTDLSQFLKGELSRFSIKNNYLWVFSTKNIYKININTKRIEFSYESKDAMGNHLKIDDIIYFNKADSIYSISNNKVIPLILKKLQIRDKNGVTITQGKPKIFKTVSSLILFEKRFRKNKFYTLDFVKKRINIITGTELIDKERIYTEFKYKNEIWFGTNTGVYVYELINNHFRFKRHFLKKNNVTKIIKDKEDNYWFATLNDGIYVIPNINIEECQLIDTNKNISSLDIVNDSILTFGTKKGDIGFYNIETGKAKYVYLPTKDRVSTLIYHPQKKTVYISKDLQSYLYNYEKKQLKYADKASKFNTGKSLTLLKNNDLLLTSYSSVLRLKNGDFNNDEVFISNNRRTYASHYDKIKEEVFVAYIDDLVKYDSLWNSIVIRDKNSPIYSKSISKTNNGTVWVSTFKNGLYGIENDKVIHHYTTKNGLSSNYLGKIKADKNKLWISLDNSIQVLNVDTKQFKTLTKREGILSYDISGIEVLNNKVFFSSNEGLFSLDKQKVFKTQKPKIYFNKVQINERDTVIVSNYQLKYNQKAIKIGFNVNGFLYNQKGKYKYRLKGLNDNWLTTEVGINTVKYNSLPIGKYIFQVQPIIENKTSKIKEKSIELTFVINKPYWETWWFILSISILIFGSIILYFYNKIKNKEKERITQLEKLSLEKELININLTALRSQMNPHFIFNALNSIQDLVLKQDTDASYDSIVLFSELIRNTLSYSGQDFISIDKELNFLKVYLQLENLRFGDDFKYTIAYNENENLEIPSLLIQPFIENALVHGLMHKKGEKELKIEFTFINKILQCVITDNGIGRSKSAKISNRQGSHHESFALSAIEKRLEIFKKQFNEHIGYTIEDLYNNEIAKGTKVIVTMPYKRRF